MKKKSSRLYLVVVDTIGLVYEGYYWNRVTEALYKYIALANDPAGVPIEGITVYQGDERFKMNKDGLYRCPLAEEEKGIQSTTLFRVTVDSIGTVYEGYDSDEALRWFNEYLRASIQEEKQGEDVTLYHGDKRLKVYEGVLCFAPKQESK